METNGLPRNSIVTPVLNEKDSVSVFFKEIEHIFKQVNCDFEILFCVDPSSDGTELKLAEMSEKDRRVKLIRFSRKVGQDKATQAGLDFADGDAVVVMDCDLQDPVEAIPKMLEKWREGYQVVYAVRVDRKKDNIAKRFFANSFYRVLNYFSDSEIPRNVGDFRLLDRRVVHEVRKYREDSFFLRALTPLIGFSSIGVEIVRPERSLGKTKYHRLFGGVKAAFVAIYGYTNFVQKIFLALTILFSSLMPLALILLLVNDDFDSIELQKLQLLVTLASLSLANFTAWTLASYLNRIHKQVLGRPNYIVEYVIGLNTNTESRRTL